MEENKRENEEMEVQANDENLDFHDSQESEEIEYQPTEEDRILIEKIAQRKREAKRKRIIHKYLVVGGLILFLSFLLTMCCREVIRLKAQNYSLKKQQQELIEERDRLAEELKHTGNKEYIKEQARKQLKLLDPGEIMFIFRDGEGETEDGE